MTKSWKIRMLLLAAATAAGYYWVGVAGLAGALVVFIFYVMLNPPPQYRKFGYGQMREADDNRAGRFGGRYDEEPPDRDPLPQGAGRNEPCPCGSGVKFKRCCGQPRTSQRKF